MSDPNALLNPESPPVKNPQPAAASWFPGHMLKAERQIREQMKRVHLVLEVRDARAPATTGNPRLAALAEARPVQVILNKCDLAEPDATAQWQRHLEDGRLRPAAISREEKGVHRRLLDTVRAALKGVNTRGHARIMIVGMPNVGKSTIINVLTGRKPTRIGGEPGVTRGQQWVNLDDTTTLLDTPGVMLPRVDEEETAMIFGLVAALHDRHVGPERLVDWLFEFVQPRLDLHDAVCGRCGIDELPDNAPALLGAIARARGILRKGGDPDLGRAAAAVLQDFRTGQYGRITLELPEGEIRQNDYEAK